MHISHGAIVFGSITIGNNVEIGANAVVNKLVPDNAVVVGVPARVLRIKEVKRKTNIKMIKIKKSICRNT